MTNALQSTSKDLLTLVEFRYGDPSDYQYLRLTNWTEDYALPLGELHTSLPTMKIELEAQSGWISENPSKITVPLNSDPLFQRLTNGEPFSRVDVKITEVFTSPAGIEHEVIFLGRLGKCAKNEKGEQELARLEMKSWKSLLTEVQLGISATPYCAWTYGDKNCKETPTDDDGTVDSIDGTEVVISGLPGRPDRFYHKGSVRKGGVWIDIRKWVSGTTFLLSRRPPSDWDSADVVVRSGCDGKLKTCRDVHDNESEFGGSGKKMPNYHPSIST